MRGQFQEVGAAAKQWIAGVAVGAFTALAAAVFSGTRAAARFEEAMVAVQKTTGLTDQELSGLSDSILSMSGELGISRGELANIAETAGQLGIQGVSNINAFTETVAKLTRVSELTASEASAQIARIANAFNLPIEQAANLGSVLNELSNTTTATAGNITQALNRVGGAGSSLGLTVDQVAALSATLIDTGIGAERAGTALRNVFIRMQTEADKLGSVVGMTGEEFNAMIQSDALGALQTYLQGISELPEALQAVRIKEVFGQENFLAVQSLAGQTDLLRQSLNTSNEAFIRASSLNNEFANSLDATTAQARKLFNSLTAWATRRSQGLLDALNSTLRALNEMSRSSEAAAESFTSLQGEMSKLQGAEQALDTYDDLIEKTDLTEQENRQLEEAIRLLEERYPGYIRQTNAAGEAISFYAGQLRGAINSQQEFNRFQQRATIEELVKNIDSAQGSAERARQAQERWNEALQKEQKLRQQYGRLGAARRTPFPFTDVREEFEQAGNSVRTYESQLRSSTEALISLFQTSEGIDMQGLQDALVQTGMGFDEASTKASKLTQRYRDLQQAQQAPAPPSIMATSGGTGLQPVDLDFMDELDVPEDAKTAFEELDKDTQNLLLHLREAEKQLKGVSGTLEDMRGLSDLDIPFLSAPESLGQGGTMQTILQGYNRELTKLRNQLSTGQITQEEFFAGAQEASSHFLGEIKDLYLELKKAGALTPQLEKAFDAAFGKAESGAAGAKKETEELGANLQAFGSALRSVSDLGDAFGVLSEEVQDVISGTANLLDNLGRFDKMGGFGGGGLAAIVPAVGIATGAASAAMGLMEAISGSSKQQREEMKRLQESLRDNAQAVKENTQALFSGGRIGGNVTQEQLQGARSIGQELQGIQSSGLGDPYRFPWAQDLLRQLNDLGIEGLPDYTELFEDLTSTMGSGRALDAILTGKGLDIQGLTETLAGLDSQFGSFSDDVEGARQSMDTMTKFFDLNLRDAINHFIDFLLQNVSELSSEAQSLLQEFRAEGTTAERRKEIAQMFAQAALGNDTGLLGGLTPDQAESIGEELLGAIEEGTAAGGGDGTTRNVAVERVITEFQANRVIALLAEQLHVLRRVLSALTGQPAPGVSSRITDQGGTHRIPEGVGGVKTAAENIIAQADPYITHQGPTHRIPKGVGDVKTVNVNMTVNAAQMTPEEVSQKLEEALRRARI